MTELKERLEAIQQLAVSTYESWSMNREVSKMTLSRIIEGLQREIENATVYEIRRLYKSMKPYSVVKQGLTLEEAQAHCNDPRTSNVDEGWFDGYSDVQTDLSKEPTRALDEDEEVFNPCPSCSRETWGYKTIRGYQCIVCGYEVETVMPSVSSSDLNDGVL